MNEKLDLINRLTALPEEISSLQIKALTQSDLIQEISEKILARESEIKAEINAAIDENGKKLYSNEEARKIAFITDSKDDQTLSDLYAEKKSASRDLDLTRIVIESKSNAQRNIRSILAVIGDVSV